jgi:hypothetical protein
LVSFGKARTRDCVTPNAGTGRGPYKLTPQSYPTCAGRLKAAATRRAMPSRQRSMTARLRQIGLAPQLGASQSRRNPRKFQTAV